MNTFTPNPTTIKRNWHLIDAEGKILGRVAAQAAVWLLGKHKPDYATHMDTGDTVVIINAEKIQTTGKKELQKSYFRHSQYPGGERSITLEKQRQEKPELILTHAVSGMLPDNKLKKPRMARLHIVIGSEHKYGQHFS
jgi:large subunit ribosomal protein L13